MSTSTPPPHRLAWLPNAISVLRLSLVPVWLVVAERSLHTSDPTAPGRDLGPLLVWLAIGVSDLVDGHLARRWHAESRAGATIDAIADKAAQIAAFTWLALRGDGNDWMTSVPPWFLGLLIGRDLLLLAGTLAVRARRGAVEVVHRWHGKAVSLLMFATVVVATTTRIPDAGGWLFTPLALFLAFSTASYVRDGFRQLGTDRASDRASAETAGERG